MQEDEWSELQANLMAQSVTTHQRNGRRSWQSAKWTQPAADHDRRRLAWAVLGGWAVGIGTLMLVQAALAFWQGVGR